MDIGLKHQMVSGTGLIMMAVRLLAGIRLMVLGIHSTIRAECVTTNGFKIPMANGII